MACNNVCRLCDNLIISSAVAFTAGTGLVITIPEGAYNNKEKYCIVIAQAIPDATTINAPVFIQIGAGTVLYPLNRCNGTQATAAEVRTRTRYATRVATTPTGGAFNLLGRLCGARDNNLASIDGTAPAAVV